MLAVFSGTVHRFDNDEKRLCTALAGLGAVALQNARLYARVFQSEDVLRKNERLTTLGLLAAEIAHEIRNPLTVIKLLYGYLNLDFPEGDPRRTDVRLIAEKLDQLEAIVTRVLGFAKGSSSLHSRWSLADIVYDTLLLVRLKLAQGKIEVVRAITVKQVERYFAGLHDQLAILAESPTTREALGDFREGRVEDGLAQGIAATPGGAHVITVAPL